MLSIALADLLSGVDFDVIGFVFLTIFYLSRHCLIIDWLETSGIVA